VGLCGGFSAEVRAKKMRQDGSAEFISVSLGEKENSFMIKLEQKQVKIISILIAVVFVGSVVALALTQSGSGIASAASSSVGVVDYRQVGSQHPQLAAANAEMQKASQEAQADFETKSASMNDQEKSDYYQQTMQRLQQKNEELMEPIENSIQDAVKKVAEKKGLSVVIEKGAVVYGGQDVTQDVIKELGSSK